MAESLRHSIRQPRRVAIAMPGALTTSPDPRLHSNEVGAARELMVACDLMMRGYPVLRSLSYTGPYDLVVEIGGKLLRVNCRTAQTKSNGLVMSAHSGVADVDILAMVSGATIAYDPPLDTLQ